MLTFYGEKKTMEEDLQSILNNDSLISIYFEYNKVCSAKFANYETNVSEACWNLSRLYLNIVASFLTYICVYTYILLYAFFWN